MQTRIIHSIVFLVIGLVLNASSYAQSSTVRSSLQEIKSAIDKSYRSYFLAFSKRDTSLFSRQYTYDCWIMISNNQAFCGPEAPGDFFSIAYNKTGVRNGKMISIDAVGNGEGFVTEDGFYEFYNDKNEEIENGKYIVIWKKTNMGWQMFRSCYSPNQNRDHVNEKMEAAKKAIAASNAIYFKSFVDNDSSIFIDRYAKDACIMAPNEEEFCNVDGFANFFRLAYNNYGLRNGRFITTAVYGDAEGFVTEEGLWQSFNGKGELFDNGKFLVLWRKTADGWKMFRDSFSSNRKIRQ